ncbi:MAG: hypothetical protein GX452_04860 [Ignavibacteriales bacterium]|jgi:hypothetical protein|nr:hypothetical protein [Ignavibacteriaceae bacterium]NLH60715.1 hypothetical protein [Ignavibacteriales bacterium]HOJ19095.1 hypothetical protein [Ignavibacteriaceae bacterium]
MTTESAIRLIDGIDKTELTSLKQELFKYAVDYSRIRVDWYLANSEGRREMEDLRSAKHTAFIDSCNVLSRAMIKKGEDATWRKRLGDDRKTIGDFACFINLITGLRAR